MFPFRHRSAPRYPSIRQALAAAGVPSAADASKLTVLERHGSYSGRPVTYFVAFDPSQAVDRAVEVRAFRDLDAYPDLVLGSGHVERDGPVVLTTRPSQDRAAPTREPAERAAHADDERLVFWNAQGARSSAAHLSEAASAWLQAGSRARR